MASYMLMRVISWRRGICFKIVSQPIDALRGIATIFEIQGKYEKAAETVDKILENLKIEWNMTEEVALKEMEQEKERLLKRASEN